MFSVKAKPVMVTCSLLVSFFSESGRFAILKVAKYLISLLQPIKSVAEAGQQIHL
jgi:hypothetical protein